MPIAARSFLLVALFVGFVTAEYYVAETMGHRLALMIDPAIDHPLTIIDHPFLRLPIVIVLLGAIFTLLVAPLREWLPNLFSSELRRLYLTFMALAAIICLVIFFAYVGLPVPTMYGVLMVDGLLLIGIVTRIVWWMSDGRAASTAESS